MNNLSEQPPDVTDDEPPPFLGAWSKVYAGVAIYLALLIALFYLFARVFVP